MCDVCLGEHIIGNGMEWVVLWGIMTHFLGTEKFLCPIIRGIVTKNSIVVIRNLL